jgi:hypothetical protein
VRSLNPLAPAPASSANPALSLALFFALSSLAEDDLVAQIKDADDRVSTGEALEVLRNLMGSAGEWDNDKDFLAFCDAEMSSVDNAMLNMKKAAITAKIAELESQL